jgi:PAS domain S-box-containing protein
VAIPDSSASGPVNILVVDDHPENRVALRAMLTAPDYRVVDAASGPEALRRLLVEEFAVLLVDVVMPEMNGFELAAAVHERARTSAVPIVFITAQANDSDFVYKGYRAGAVDYLMQPLVPEMVRAKVAVFAEMYRQRKRIEHQSLLLVEAERKENDLRLVELRLAGDRRFRNLTEAIPQIIWTAHATGGVDYFNQRWFEYTGISAADSAGSWLGAIHPDDVEACSAGWRAALDAGQMFEGEVRLRGASGNYRWHLCRAVPERSASGGIEAWLGTFTDIEAQKRAHEVLAEFKGTLDAVLDAVVIFDQETWRLRYANQGAFLLWGYPSEELTRMRPFELMTDYDESRLRELLAPLREKGRGAITVETGCRRRDGTEIPGEVSFQLVEVGASCRLVAIARDITERKLAGLEREQLYGEALTAIRARDEFLSIASHEFRAPLSSLQLQLEMLVHPRAVLPGRAAPAPAPEPIRSKLDIALRQVNKLSGLVAELLDVSRITSGRLHLELEEVPLAGVVRDVIARFQEDAAKAGCRVTLEAEEVVLERADRLRIEQVATNLLANALKFGAGKPVELAVSAAGRSARLVVRDHGIGIGPEDAERIFQRFERATAARSFAGLGLGLYIARQIVDAHGGRISVESQPGAGCTFIVDVPFEGPAEGPSDEAGSEARAARQ